MSNVTSIGNANTVRANIKGEMEFNKGMRYSSVTVNTSGANTTLNDTHYYLVAKLNGFSCQYFLPSAVGILGRTYVFKSLTTGAVTITPNGSELIDDKANFVIANKYDSVTLFSDGTGWLII